MSTVRAESEHCKICFDALWARLRHQPTRHFEQTDSLPLFVTWKKDGRLRGCIGNLSPIPFPQGLVEYAIRAGLHDSRFDPIMETEFSRLTVGVSLLVDFIPDRAWDDWEVGLHGIVMRFDHHDQHYKAVFLPEVASEQGWTKRQTIEALAKKSGFQGRIDQNLLAKIKIESFVSSKAEMTYSEWLEEHAKTEETNHLQTASNTTRQNNALFM